MPLVLMEFKISFIIIFLSTFQIAPEQWLYKCPNSWLWRALTTINRILLQKQPPEVFYKERTIKKETLAQAFSCKFCEISKNTFFPERLWTTASFISLIQNHID